MFMFTPTAPPPGSTRQTRAENPNTHENAASQPHRQGGRAVQGATLRSTLNNTSLREFRGLERGVSSNLTLVMTCSSKTLKVLRNYRVSFFLRLVDTGGARLNGSSKIRRGWRLHRQPPTIPKSTRRQRHPCWRHQKLVASSSQGNASNLPTTSAQQVEHASRCLMAIRNSVDATRWMHSDVILLDVDPEREGAFFPSAFSMF
ncbi:hypothetical protein VTJ83DRAFT_6037 [Remersonia thermophila]|uniref:Uncharacterized protein n=1 Tax=Remersonia thermophila TaxID=72144 RepID=A0ABR4D9A5_9PEZI